MPTDAPTPPAESAPRPLTVAYVPGVTPGKWITRWRERQDQELRAYPCEEPAALEEVRSHRADMAFVRVPAEGFVRPEGMNLIPLYEEQPVAAAAKDHPLAAFDEISLADLDGEPVLDVAELGGPAVALETVAAGSGVVVLPMSVARLHARRDVASRPVHGVPATRIGLAWLQDRDEPEIEEFIGVVRGRSANSSRQPSVQAEQKASAGRRTKERQTQGQKGKPAAAAGGKSGKSGKSGKPVKPGKSGKGSGKPAGKARRGR